MNLSLEEIEDTNTSNIFEISICEKNHNFWTRINKQKRMGDDGAVIVNKQMEYK